VPGEPDLRPETKWREKGITLAVTTAKELEVLGESLGIALPLLERASRKPDSQSSTYNERSDDVSVRGSFRDLPF
jgi:hypothetical protein